MKESLPTNERPISPEEFFNTKIETYRLTKENFCKIVKQRNPEMDDDKILQAKGINFEMNGKVLILLRTDKFPEEYMPYLETHEKWEAYIARKNGYNLWDKSIREYKEDKEITNFDDENTRKFLKDNPEGYWFKAKLYGWGWAPAKWQGWLVILIYVALIATLALTREESISGNPDSGSNVLTFALPIIALTALLIFVCYKKGEKPHWQWGPKK